MDKRIADRRIHDNLRKMVDEACKGVMPHMTKHIKDAARRAYYLGVLDGMQIEREKECEQRKAS